jgi:protein-L-isoaspartate O-methyltransferase
MLINAGVTHPHALWLERLCEGGRLVLPLTIAASATLGQDIMVRIVRHSGGLSANGGADYGRAAEAEVAAPRRARAGRLLCVPHAGHVPEHQARDMRT